MTKRMILMLAGCLLIFGGIFGMQAFGKKQMQAYFDNMPISPQTISTAKAVEMSWPRVIQSIGTFSAVNGTTLAVESDGVVEEILFESGQEVTQGTLLLSLKDDTEKAEYERLKAQAALAKISSERNSKLAKRKAISKSEYDAVVAEAAAAQAAADAQAARLAQKQLIAPFDGQLGIRRVNLGEFLSRGATVVSLQALSPLEVEFALPEKELPNLQVGLPIAARVDAYPGQDFMGTVSAIEPQVNVTTRLFHVRARFENADKTLRPGMFGTLSVQLPQAQQVVAVPRTAIKYDPYGSSVFIAKEEAQEAHPMAQGPVGTHVALNRFVKLGKARGDYLQILEGVEVGDEVVSSGLLKVRNGLPLIVNNEVVPNPQLNAPSTDY